VGSSSVRENGSYMREAVDERQLGEKRGVRNSRVLPNVNRADLKKI